jgi:hypothetical protein
MNKSEYIALKARIEYELRNIDLIEKALEKEGLFPKPVSSRISGLDIDSDIARRAIGSYLHDYYSAVEKIASHICSNLLPYSILASPVYIALTILRFSKINRYLDSSISRNDKIIPVTKYQDTWRFKVSPQLLFCSFLVPHQNYIPE